MKKYKSLYPEITSFENLYQAFKKAASIQTSEVWETSEVWVRVVAYCLMPNHFHLLVCPQDDQLLGI